MFHTDAKIHMNLLLFSFILAFFSFFFSFFFDGTMIYRLFTTYLESDDGDRRPCSLLATRATDLTGERGLSIEYEAGLETPSQLEMTDM